MPVSPRARVPARPAEEHFATLRVAVHARHEELARRITHALGKLSPEWAARRRLAVSPSVDYALLHHTLFAAQQAAAQAAPGRALRALALWEEPRAELGAVVATAQGPVCVVASTRCEGNAGEAGDDAVPYTVTQEALRAAPPVTGAFVAEALSYVAAAGLQAYLEEGMAVAVLLAQRAPADVTASYSVTALPGTVYTDWTPDAVRLGEGLLHEAAHCWLNECLAACGEQLPAEPTWYSPWKNRPRSAFGLLHAAFIFALLLHYFDHISQGETFPLRARQYCRARKEAEAQRLHQVAPSVREALRLLRSDAVRELLRSEFEGALGRSDGHPQGHAGSPASDRGEL
jgi:hypothetical protein